MDHYFYPRDDRGGLRAPEELAEPEELSDAEADALALDLARTLSAPEDVEKNVAAVLETIRLREEARANGEPR